MARPGDRDVAAAPATEPATTPAPQAAAADAAPSGKDLLDTVNAAAGTVAGLHVAFMALSAYLLVTVWGTTHRDLALDSPVKLPLIDVQVGLTSFYAAAPWLYWLVHLNLLIQFELLARKTWAFAGADDYAALAPRLYVFPFIHYLLHGAGRLVRPLLAVAVFTSVIAFPWFVLLFVQVKFLAYHSEAITWWQRGAVWMDAAMVLWFWPLIAACRGAWWRGFVPECRRNLKDGRKLWTSPWLSTWLMLAGFVFTTGFATVALVPGLRYEMQDEEGSEKLVWHIDGFEGQLVRWLGNMLPDPSGCCWQPRWQVRGALTLRVRAKAADEGSEWPAACLKQVMRGNARFRCLESLDVLGKLGPTLWLTAWLFDPHRDAQGDEIGADAEPLLARLLPERYLDLHGEMLLDEKPSAEVLHALRHDLDGLPDDLGTAGAAPAKHAPEKPEKPEKRKSLKDWLAQTVPLGKLKGRDLQGAELSEAVLPLADLNGTRLAGASLVGAQLQGARLYRAQLQGASLVGAQFQGARLDDAQLQCASLDRAQLQGARLDDAQLQGARLDRAQLQGASLDNARLQGARLDGARLDAADLSGATLTGADGAIASAESAVLRGVSDQPLSADEAEGLRQSVASYLGPKALEAFTARLTAARQQGFGTLRLTQGDCFGPEALGCREQDRDFAAFRADEHLPALVLLACADTDVARGLIRRWWFASFGLDTDRADFGLAQKLTARLGDAKCKGLATLADADREDLKQAVAAEQAAAKGAAQRP